MLRAVSIMLAALLPALPLHAAPEPPRRVLDLRTPMRDGVRLSSDVWLPAMAGKYPIILARTPYLRTSDHLEYREFGEFFARNGYAFVVQDVRGRGDSEGEFDWLFQEARDGYDSIERLAREPWANGAVCMMGVSYLGSVQWLAAKERPPSLKCLVSTAAAGRYMDEVPYMGGAFLLSWGLTWINRVSGRVEQAYDGIDWERAYRHRPLLTADEVAGRKMPLYRDILQHPTTGPYWDRITVSDEEYSRMSLPVLHVTGWFDSDQPGAMTYWNGMSRHSPNQAQQYLIVGPWDHGQTFLGGATRKGELQFGSDSIIDNKALHLQFFERYLKGAATAFEMPRVRLYVTGANEWRNYQDYPVAARQTRLHMESSGRANSLDGDGALQWEVPRNRVADRYTFDPERPVPYAYSNYMAVDRRPIERRDDVLVYTGDVLQQPLEIIGPVRVELHAASDAKDTDFTASLVDVHPDGRAVILGPLTGIVRARYREGRASEKLLTPGKIERFTIELGHFGHAFQPGHRVRLEISSSAFPIYDVNPNTGLPIATDPGPMRPARQEIHHGGRYPSALLLPVTSPQSSKPH